MGQDRPDVPQRRPKTRVQAREQRRVPHEDLERHDVHGRTPAEDWRTGDAVQEPRRRRTAVSVAGPADRGKLHRVAERPGHRNRPLGPPVAAGRRARARAGRRRPHV